MSTSQVRWLALAGIIVGTVGVFFFGVLAIMIAVVLFGLSVLGLAANVAAPTPTPRRGWGFTCSACGGELLGVDPDPPHWERENVPPHPPPQERACGARIFMPRGRIARQLGPAK